MISIRTSALFSPDSHIILCSFTSPDAFKIIFYHCFSFVINGIHDCVHIDCLISATINTVLRHHHLLPLTDRKTCRLELVTKPFPEVSFPWQESCWYRSIYWGFLLCVCLGLTLWFSLACHQDWTINSLHINITIFKLHRPCLHLYTHTSLQRVLWRLVLRCNYCCIIYLNTLYLLYILINRQVWKQCQVFFGQISLSKWNFIFGVLSLGTIWTKHTLFGWHIVD